LLRRVHADLCSDLPLAVLAQPPRSGRPSDHSRGGPGATGGLSAAGGAR
jgi:hypothetical protein